MYHFKINKCKKTIFCVSFCYKSGKSLPLILSVTIVPLRRVLKNRPLTDIQIHQEELQQ
jgi:hypothetical protein